MSESVMDHEKLPNESGVTNEDEDLNDDFARHKRLEQSRQRVAKKKENKNSVDICFVIDATQSMAPWIKETTKCFNEIYEKVKGKLGQNGKIRFAYVAYRDRSYASDDQVICHNFTEEISTLQSWINEKVKAKACEFNDYCEDCASGLEVAEQLLHSESGKKILIWVADAPNHGSDWNNGGDDFPDDNERMEQVLTRLCNENINVHFMHINSHTKKMIERARRFIPKIQEQNLNGDVTKLVDSVTDAVSEDTGIRLSKDQGTSKSKNSPNVIRKDSSKE